MKAILSKKIESKININHEPFIFNEISCIELDPYVNEFIKVKIKQHNRRVEEIRNFYIQLDEKYSIIEKKAYELFDEFVLELKNEINQIFKIDYIINIEEITHFSEEYTFIKVVNIIDPVSKYPISKCGFKFSKCLWR